MYLKCEYRDDGLDVDFYPHLLNHELAIGWYSYLEELIPHEARRNSVLFGDPGIVYTVNYMDTTSNRPVMPWTELPALQELKSLVEAVTEQKYTVCVIQRYPNGNIGINPHRDKEMVLGTRICGLSLGATRELMFSKHGFEPVTISLNSGSLYVMKPPTNQKWLHSIIKNRSIVEPRFSLTFRDYR